MDHCVVHQTMLSSGANSSNKLTGDSREMRFSKNQCIVIAIIIIIIVVGMVGYSSQTPSRLSNIPIMSDDFIKGLEYNPISTLAITNSSHLILYDLYHDNVTETIHVPEGRFSIEDFIFYGGAIYLVNTNGSLQVYDYGNLYNVAVPDVMYDGNLNTITTEDNPSKIYLGGDSTGIIIFDRSNYTAINITTSDGLLSNQVTYLNHRTDKLLVSVSGGFHVYDTSDEILYNVVDIPDPTKAVYCMEYYSGTSDLFIGTQYGLHICRFMDNHWKYLYTLGERDGLPSPKIRDFELDVTNHKMIVATSKGVCFLDLYDYNVELLEETTTTGFHPFCIHYYYSFSKLFIGTSDQGLWQISDIYVRAPEMVSWEQLEPLVFFVLGNVATVLIIEFQRSRTPQEKPPSSVIAIGSVLHTEEDTKPPSQGNNGTT